jgi:hypothetical protein
MRKEFGLPLAHRLGETGDQCDLARKVGRPSCGFSGSASIVWEGREAMRGKACDCC